jgi:hypothetical protein
MTATPNLGISHIAASQAQKEVTANGAFDALDLAMTGLLSIALHASTDSPLALTGAQALRCAAIRFTGTVPAGFRANLPAVTKPYIVMNAASGAVTVGVAGNEGVTLATGRSMLVCCDGADVMVVG